MNTSKCHEVISGRSWPAIVLNDGYTLNLMAANDFTAYVCIISMAVQNLHFVVVITSSGHSLNSFKIH